LYVDILGVCILTLFQIMVAHPNYLQTQRGTL
jgi:hypothetical protein